MFQTEGSGEFHGFLYDDRSGQAHDIGKDMLPRAINDAGEVVGQTFNGRAFTYIDGEVTTIAVGGSAAATAINNHGDVVGVDGENQGFIYTHGELKQLKSMMVFPLGSEFNSLEPSGINDAGQIIGRGSTSNGYTHAFLLNPTVPEPASLPAILLGVTTLLRRRWVA